MRIINRNRRTLFAASIAFVPYKYSLASKPNFVIFTWI